jgi:hypothetical protein
MKIACPLRPSGALCLFAAALSPVLAESASPAHPVKLAIFDCELEDFSAGASVTKGSPADKAPLEHVTGEIRRLMAASGRYSLIDTRSTDAGTMKAHELRTCGGCEAGIALKLGAEQSLIAVVTRVSRTDYTIALQIRDAKTGTIIANKQSGLRMGADYSWSRGAAALIKEHLLDQGN